MKLQRYVTNDGVMPPGTWVKASDAEALEAIIEHLKSCKNCRHNFCTHVLKDASVCVDCAALSKWEVQE